jgi:hypothetical protein
MTFSVNQPWDPLRVCAVGRSFPPEYYAGIQNVDVRSVLERIAQETEEDYQQLISTLNKFDITVCRTDLPTQFKNNSLGNRQFPPPMTPRDHMAMIGDTFFMPSQIGSKWNNIRGESWPKLPPMNDVEFAELPDNIRQELAELFDVQTAYDVHDYDHSSLTTIKQLVQEQKNNIIYDKKIDTAMVVRAGKDLYFGTWGNEDQIKLKNSMQDLFTEYRCHVIPTNGHLDGTFCVVKPGLIVSSHDISLQVFEQHFPGWEVFYIKNIGSTLTDSGFLKMKEQCRGNWWVPGEEDNQDFIRYVNTYVQNWTGCIHETTIDVNMLSIDEHNVLCIQENLELFKVFERHGITPHVVNFRHYMFWDGGLHCVTNDLAREGDRKDYFPERSCM